MHEDLDEADSDEEEMLLRAVKKIKDTVCHKYFLALPSLLAVHIIIVSHPTSTAVKALV